MLVRSHSVAGAASVALLVTVVVRPTAAQLPPDSAVAAIVEARIRAGVTPGLVVGLIDADGHTRMIARGDERPGRPLDTRSVFEIGSISKVFTASILADMVARGEVRLDDPVAKYLPAGVKVPERGGKQIRLVDLSTQTSGLPRLPDNLHPKDPANPYADYTVAQLYDFLGRYQLTRDIGAQYEYSNLGVGLLGHVLALRAGKSYDELLHERILGPLGMRSTGVALTPAMRARLTPGHEDGREVPNWDIVTLAGAGGIRSDLEDMLKFLAANVFPEQSALGKEMATTHAIRVSAGKWRSPGTPPDLWVGLNWHVLTGSVDTIVWHNGGTGGYHTFIGFRPARHVGVVVLANSTADIDDIGFHLLDARMPLTAQHVAIALPPDALDAFPGEYRLAPTFSIVITREGAQLYAQATNQPRFPVYPESANDFFYRVVDAQITFNRDTTGKVTGLVLHQNGQNLPAPKVK